MTTSYTYTNIIITIIERLTNFVDIHSNHRLYSYMEAKKRAKDNKKY